MKKRVLAIAATAMATMMMASPVMAQDFKIGICNYVDDASLNQIVDNLESRLKEIGDEKGVNFDISYDNCNADANVMEQIISDFQADGVDLMVGVATPVAMRMQASRKHCALALTLPYQQHRHARPEMMPRLCWCKALTRKQTSGRSCWNRTLQQRQRLKR